MADNGENAHGVTFGRIMFLQEIIAGHDNVASFNRHDDIVFDLSRKKQRDTIQIVCVDEYAFSESMAREIISEFPTVSIIFVGGKWNKPTSESMKYCRAKNKGICNAGTINAVLSKSTYWQ